MRFIFLLSGLLFWNIGFSQKLDSWGLLPCNSYGEYIYKERIASQRLIHDTLYLEVALMRNCDISLKPELIVRGDSLFITLKNVSEIYAACDCCYSMLFAISGIRGSAFHLFID